MHCLKHGTQLGWFIEPSAKSAIALSAALRAIAFLSGQQPIELTGEDILPVPKFLDLQLTVAQVFDWLKTGKKQ